MLADPVPAGLGERRQLEFPLRCLAFCPSSNTSRDWLLLLVTTSLHTTYSPLSLLLYTLRSRVSYFTSPPIGTRENTSSAASYTYTTKHHITDQPHTMARFSRDQRRRSSPSTSPWMTMFYICALVFAPMLFMSMIPSAHAQEDVKEASLTGPGKSRMVYIKPARSQC
jgi:hypothetical protein